MFLSSIFPEIACGKELYIGAVQHIVTIYKTTHLNYCELIALTSSVAIKLIDNETKTTTTKIRNHYISVRFG